jgi:hypothetical protein
MAQHIRQGLTETHAMLLYRATKLPIILYSGCLDIPKEAFALVDGFVAKGDGSMFLVSMIRSVLSRKKPPGRELRWDSAPPPRRSPMRPKSSLTSLQILFHLACAAYPGHS